MKINMSDLRYLLENLNNITKNDKYPYTLYIAYGKYGLDKIVNDGGGTKTIIPLTTKKELYNLIIAIIKGIEIEKEYK